LWTLVYGAIADRNKVTAELRTDGLRWWSGFGNPLEVRWADVTAVAVKRTAAPQAYDRRAEIRDLTLQSGKKLSRIANADFHRTREGETLTDLVTRLCRRRNIPVEERY